jgi:2-phospho-L-lactate guanylyltransferase (CobY/MobA/RfbA family)
VQYVVPFRPGGKTRLGDSGLALAMLRDVVAAVRGAGGEATIAAAPGGQGAAVAAALAAVDGPVTIVNGDLPCVTSEEVAALADAAPALVAARDGTTNALALRHARDFAPLYGPGSASRFATALGAASLALPGLRDDVDTWDDVDRVRRRLGAHTRRYLARLEHARAS